MRRQHRHGIRALAAIAALSVPCAATHAQDRLIGSSAFGTGLTMESVRFGGTGFSQPGLSGDTLRLRGVSQMSVPLSLAIPMGTQWTLDVQSVFARVSLQYDAKAGTSYASGTATLSGLSDVRLRTTGRLFDDAVTLTAGLNVPTGKTNLGATELTVLRASAAPALALGAPPIGTGTSGTVGAVYAREIGGWAVALGGSYELRGSYQPVAALTAGAPSLNFAPGNVMRGSLGLDRVMGSQRVSLSAAIDMYSDDVLRDPAATANAVSKVRLGPVMTLDGQWQLAVPRLKDVSLWGTFRSRSTYARDGVTVAGTSATYLDLGGRGSLPLSATTDLFATVDIRSHSGLQASQGLATAGITAVGSTVGLSVRRGALSLQPYVRVQVGSLKATGIPSTAMTGNAVGCMLVTRF